MGESTLIFFKQTSDVRSAGHVKWTAHVRRTEGYKTGKVKKLVNGISIHRLPKHIRHVAWGSLGYETRILDLLSTGKASTREEAAKMVATKGHQAYVKSFIDKGGAASVKEAEHLIAKQRYEGYLQKILDSGEAQTLEEAASAHGKAVYAASLKNLV